MFRKLGFALVLAAAACAPPAAKPVVEVAAPDAPAGFVESAKGAIQKYVDRNEFSGAVLVAKGGKPVLREGFGLATRAPDTPVTPETVFRLGSITKQFTSASIMQLVEAGKISVDDPVSKYYPAAPKAWEKITVRHLLNHRSGIPSYTGLPGFFEKMSQTDRTPAQIIELTRDKPLEFEPGAKFAYNNTGYVTLGYIIEKVSGQSYADFLQAHIFQPLGLKNSGYEVTSALPPNYAEGFGVKDGVWAKSPPLSMTLPYAAGSLYSTVDDLLAWEMAFFGDKVVSKASREEMTTPGGPEGYGYGLAVANLGGHKVIRHNGGINGFSTSLSHYPDDALTVVVLANLESAPSDKIADEIARFYLGVPAPPPPPTLVEVPVKPEVLDRYAGVYELMPGFDITLKREGDKLAAQATGQGAFTLVATSDTEFHFQPAGIRMVFPEGKGPAPSFVLHQGGERVAKRKP